MIMFVRRKCFTNLRQDYFLVVSLHSGWVLDERGGDYQEDKTNHLLIGMMLPPTPVPVLFLFIPALFVQHE